MKNLNTASPNFHENTFIEVPVEFLGSFSNIHPWFGEMNTAKVDTDEYLTSLP